MTLDRNKQISGVSYNYLNLPDQIDLEQDEMKHIFYAYDALGTKLQKTTYGTGYLPGPATDYCGRFVYSDGNLQFVQHAEGRLVPRENGGFDYQYYLKDHLGNTRITMNQNGTVLQEDTYYPFGMNISGLSYSNTSPENKYRYNGKELQDEFGLDWYDYGARFYDAVLGRWHVVDPLAEESFEWTPYRYGFNNPIIFKDPRGMLETRYEDEEGNELLNTNDGSSDVVVVPNENIEEFQAIIDFAEETGTIESLDDPHWNDNMKAEFLGFESIQEMEETLSNVSSQWSRQKLIEVIQGNNDFSLVEFAIVEVISQLANPLNHIPSPVKLKGKLPLKQKGSAKANSWHQFNREMGKGKFTKKKYGSSEAASKARRSAYKKWKKEKNFE